MSVAQPLPRGEASWTDRYERLRYHALGGPAPIECDAGLDVLLQRGVAGWMRIASNFRATAGACAASIGWMVADHDAAMLVLAEMAFRHVVHLERGN